MISIDGSTGDGGGHLVRTALTLAAATAREVEITNIRARRTPSGMRADLLGVAQAVAEVTRGRVDGASLGSDTLFFKPGTVEAGRFDIALTSAGDVVGSAALALQAIAPALGLASARCEVSIHGATHGHGGPTATYLQTVFAPTAKKFGLRMEVVCPRWGWAPSGCGEMRARIEPVDMFHSAELTQRGELLQIGGSAVSSGLDDGYSERQQNRVSRRMSEVGRAAQIQISSHACESAGGMIFLLAVFERTIAGFTAVARPGTTAEQTADEAVNELFAYLTSYTVLDKHVADQVLVYAALADGVSTFSTAELTPRTLATAEVIRKLVPALVSFDGKVGGPADVEVVGAGGRR